MITNFKLYCEDYNTGIVRINLDGHPSVQQLKVEETEKGTRVYLMIDDKVYDELSIILPNSNDLDKSEFFVNPNIDKNIVDELENQNFINRTNTVGNAAGKKTISYSLSI